MNVTAGTYESSDCLIRLSPSTTRKVIVESIVFDQFGEAIQRVLNDTLDQYGVSAVQVECFDKGALDYTVRARLITALKRGGYIE